MSRLALVLAAGEGTRMRSDRPKVLHAVCGRPMVAWVLDALQPIREEGMLDRILVVVGNGAQEVASEVGDRAECIIQEERKGTGHAVMIAAPHVREDEVLVLTADSPLITTGTLRALIRRHEERRPAATLLAAVLEDPTGYGRIKRDERGTVVGVVEETEADEKEKAIREVNTSTYVFDWGRLSAALPRLQPDNAKGEYYLTDALALLAREGGLEIYTTPDPEEVLGVNSRVHLARAEEIMRSRINRRWMEEGVTMEDPATAYIGPEVVIGRDTVLRPMVILEGKTVVGRNCLLGPGVRIVDSRLGDGVTVEQSVIRESELEEGVSVGPFASLRPGTVLRAGSKAGTFVEIKKTVVGRRSKVPHLSYMGDAEIGEDVNVGAGSITCNYDGIRKHRTVIGDRAFIGSDTMFVAPVRIGEGAVTGAGSTITRDVPPGALGVERSKQRNILEYRKRARKEEAEGFEGNNP
ncbi:bifunctional UDP-N-acetylglucosamine diphosphorylase/glucosamine-1-phosphate N-acetyltransferase GlmU [Candidatus Solincola sp.]|nr:bifunctional UDP-N-acetylglucosamine diphosphorylase/glucosamine-1-phosphate N-acetyltransferase GlmU [Actinomycetota bacterium]MDI7251012.1 bifunctional UDP-N-acetylglucosamine diphosphorylase/glucosamine-1-phosphate N-acetyltransferase GlmU [Actinomycetota bacterium]